MRLGRVGVIALALLTAAVALPLPAFEVAQPAVAPGLCPPLGDQATVEIKDNFFDPQVKYVQAGDTVHWVNVGQNPHTTTSNADPPLWDSGVLNYGEHFSYKFCWSGSFPYHCAIHGFTGTIVVS